MSSTRVTSPAFVRTARTLTWPAWHVSIALGLTVASGAFADAAPASQSASKDAAMAQALFDEAKQSMASGDYAAACPKLAESYRLDPGSGTLTALAVCHENTGKTATAWAEFVEVASEAKQQGRPDREAFAQLHVAALDPKVPRLTIQVAPSTAQIPNLEVKRDGVLIGAAAWGVAAPVDPGDHVVEVTAPNKQPWSSHVTMAEDGDKKVVTVPDLADVPQDTTASSAPEQTPAQPVALSSEPESRGRDSGSAKRTAGIVVASAGAVSAIVGSIFGVEAISSSQSAKKLCQGSSCSNMQGFQDNQTAKSDAMASDVFIAAGVAAIGGGAYLFFTAPSSRGTSAARPHLVPVFGQRSAGLALQSSW